MLQVTQLGGGAGARGRPSSAVRPAQRRAQRPFRKRRLRLPLLQCIGCGEVLMEAAFDYLF